MAKKDIKKPETDTVKEELAQDIEEEISEQGFMEDEPEDLEEEDDHNSLSSSILRVLAVLAVGAVGGIWAAPKVAPMLPAGLTPVAEFLSPQADTSEQFTALQKDFEARIAKIESLDKQQETMDQITPELDELKNTDVSLSAEIDKLSNANATLGQSIANLQEELTKITARQALTAQNGQVSDEALQQFEDKLSAITKAQQKLNSSQTQAVEAQQNAHSKLRLAEATHALAQISSALKTGKSFQTEMTQFSDVSGLTAPAELTNVARQGTRPLSALKRQLPDLARTALRDDAAANANGTTLGQFTSFLKAQVGTRSLEPQTGNDLDAVLSRIEAAMNASDTSSALSETDGLSEPARNTMVNWIASLQQLHNATIALQTLQQQLTAN